MSTHNIPFQYKEKITINYPRSAAMVFSKKLKNEFEKAVVNEPSVFEPLKVYGLLASLNKICLYISTPADFPFLSAATPP